MNTKIKKLKIDHLLNKQAYATYLQFFFFFDGHHEIQLYLGNIFSCFLQLGKWNLYIQYYCYIFLMWVSLNDPNNVYQFLLQYLNICSLILPTNSRTCFLLFFIYFFSFGIALHVQSFSFLKKHFLFVCFKKHMRIWKIKK